MPNEYPNIFETFQIWRMNTWIYSTLLNSADEYPNVITFSQCNVHIKDHEIEGANIENKDTLPWYGVILREKIPSDWIKLYFQLFYIKS